MVRKPHKDCQCINCQWERLKSMHPTQATIAIWTKRIVAVVIGAGYLAVAYFLFRRVAWPLGLAGAALGIFFIGLAWSIDDHA